MKLFRKALILLHRYLGIALSLLFVMWFATGIVMMYAGGMPQLNPQSRLDRLPALDVARVRLTPADAVERAEMQRSPGRVLLLTVLDRPAYRFGSPGGSVTVFADTGELLDELDVAQTANVASRFVNVPLDKLRHVGEITRPDQWTLQQGRQMPLHKFRADDNDATEIYVSPATGEVTVETTRRSRLLAWIGTIPHWLYFASLRLNQPVWRQVVVWSSGLGCVLALMGLILAVTQYRVQYRGVMRWHYVTGVIFGVFTLTWVFSGLLSMEPWGWATNPGLEVGRHTFTGGPVDLSRFPAMDAGVWDRVPGGRSIKEVEFVRIQSDPYYVVRHATDTQAQMARRERLHQPYNVTGRFDENRLLVSASSLEIRREPFSVESLVARLRGAVPRVPIVDSELLTEYDSYYYSRGRQTPLPVLRVKFADPDKTWVYIDPEMSVVLARIHRLDRVERWIYNGLHSLDFSFWYQRRPVWDIGMIALSIGGLASSAAGLWMGIRRLRRQAKRPARALETRPAQTVGVPLA